MDKLEKQRLMKEWLDQPARLKPPQTRATRSKRAVKKADKSTVRSTSEQIKRGEEASQIYLILRELPECSGVMKKCSVCGVSGALRQQTLSTPDDETTKRIIRKRLTLSILSGLNY